MCFVTPFRSLRSYRQASFAVKLDGKGYMAIELPDKGILVWLLAKNTVLFSVKQMAKIIFLNLFVWLV